MTPTQTTHGIIVAPATVTRNTRRRADTSEGDTAGTDVEHRPASGRGGRARPRPAPTQTPGEGGAAQRLRSSPPLSRALRATPASPCLVIRSPPSSKPRGRRAQPDLRDGRVAGGGALPGSFTEQVPASLPAACHVIHHAKPNQQGVKTRLRGLLSGVEPLHHGGRPVGRVLGGSPGALPQSPERKASGGRGRLPCWAPHCEKCSRCRRNATDSFFLLLAGPFPFSSVSAQLERLHRQAEKWLLQSVAHT